MAFCIVESAKKHKRFLLKTVQRHSLSSQNQPPAYSTCTHASCPCSCTASHELWSALGPGQPERLFNNPQQSLQTSGPCWIHAPLPACLPAHLPTLQLDI